MRAALLFSLLLSPIRASAFTIDISTFTLANGFRVVLAPDRSVPVAAMSMIVPVGARQETKGRSGFAHLFEHLMFEGSGRVKKGEFDAILERLGAESNASTHQDVTFYYEMLPANALEIAYWLDADRLSGLAVTHKGVKTQVAVVEEEKRQNVLEEPYMPSLWVGIQRDVFSNWANKHDTYGDFADLEAADLGDVKRFFSDWYSPSNTIIAVVGDFDPADARARVEKYFSWIPDRSARVVPDAAEPPQTAPRTFQVEDKHARSPALATVWTGMPERGTRDYYATVLLGQYLYAGKSGRLYQRLVKEEQVATAVDEPYAGGLGFPISDWAEFKAPGLFGGIVLQKPQASVSRVDAMIAEEIAKLAQNGVPATDLERVKTKFKSDWIVGAETVLGRAWMLLRHAAFDGDAGRINGELERFLSVTPEETREAAARFLTPATKNSFIITPAGESQ